MPLIGDVFGNRYADPCRVPVRPVLRCRLGLVVRHAKRVDANHAEIRDGLRALGYDVLDLSDVGGGIPDLCLRHPNHYAPLFLEVKDGNKPPSARVLTESEREWFRYCGAITLMVLSLDEAIEVVSRWLKETTS